MATIVDETAGTISFTETTITFPYGFSASSGIGTIIITPAGGVASFPIAIQGASGLPPVITWVYEEVAPADPLPSPNPAVVQTDPGGPGEASTYTITIYGHKGDQGDPAAFNILDGDDIDGTVTDEYVLAKKAGESKVVFVPMKAGAVATSAAIAATGFTATNPRLLTTVTFAAKPYARKVVVSGQIVVTGSVDTRVDLVAYLGNPDSGGVEIGRGFGAAGAAPPPVALSFGPPNTATGSGDNYAVIAADATGVVYFRAEQMASSSSGWSTAAAPNGARLAAMAVAT